MAKERGIRRDVVGYLPISSKIIRGRQLSSILWFKDRFRAETKWNPIVSNFRGTFSGYRPETLLLCFGFHFGCIWECGGMHFCELRGMLFLQTITTKMQLFGGPKGGVFWDCIFQCLFGMRVLDAIFHWFCDTVGTLWPPFGVNLRPPCGTHF